MAGRCTFFVNPGAWEAHVGHDYNYEVGQFQTARSVHIGGYLHFTAPRVFVNGRRLSPGRPVEVSIVVRDAVALHTRETQDAIHLSRADPPETTVRSDIGSLDYYSVDKQRALLCDVKVPPSVMDELVKIVRTPGLPIKSVTLTAFGDRLLATSDEDGSYQWKPGKGVRFGDTPGLYIDGLDYSTRLGSKATLLQRVSSQLR